MRAILKNLWNEFPNVDLENYHPDVEDDFGLYLNFTVGLEDSKGGDDFHVLVCSPAWLMRECRKGPVWGRHLLITDRFDLNEIRRSIEARLEEYSGESWEEIAEKISRYAAWEFEDYVH